jgi:soluble lytic murein transglycosylase-like protein
MIRFSAAMLCLAVTALPASARTGAATSHGGLDALIASYASANGVPESLVHRVIVRESRYNPRAVGRGGAMGLMQIKHATARGLGYSGSASGLLDPETNLSYAVRYLAGAYRAAGGNENRAVSYYARGYYYAAKRQGTRVEALAQPAN